MEHGSVFNNVRLVPKRVTRAWSSETAALETLLTLVTLDEASPRCILSPAKAEKLVGKSAFSKTLDFLVTSESSGMTLKFNR